MKIVQVIPSFGVAGAEIMCETLLYELRKRGHEVLAISLYDEHTVITERLESAGVDVRYLHKKSGFDFSLFGKLKKLFKEEKPDVVHTHLYASKYAVLAAKKAKVPRIVHTVHSLAEYEQKGLGRKLQKRFYQKRRVTPVAISDAVQASIESLYGLPKEEIPVVYNGIDLTKCKVKTSYEVEGNFKILHVGRFAEVKNHAGLLRAFERFHSRYAQSELWLVGDGEGRASAERFVAEQGLESAVRFFGIQRDVYSFLGKADTFVLPSHYEGLGITLIEAMGTGLPIVASAVGGILDMLDGESALLVPVEDEAFAEAFTRYYEDEGLRRTNGEKARKASERFSSLEMAALYEKIYVK